VDCEGTGAVDLSGHGRLGGFGITQSYRIMVYTETVSNWPTSATSEVQISRQALRCPGTTITPIGESPPFDLSALLLAFGGAAAVAVAVVIVILGILLALWLLARTGGARKLFKKAVG